MLLFHGTTATVADIATREGLRPRGKRRSNYKAASHPDAVYLTNAYAPFFACNARNPIEHGCAVLVIDTSRLHLGSFAPDEDALEQVSRDLSPDHAMFVEGNLHQRTKRFRNDQFKYAAMGYDFVWSLNVLGTCCYHGVIPPNAIVKSVEWRDPDTIGQTALIFDPVISIFNFRFAGARYRNMIETFTRVETGAPSLSEFDRFGLNFERMNEFFNSERFKHRDNPAY